MRIGGFTDVVDRATHEGAVIVSPQVFAMPRREAASPLSQPIRVLLADGEWLVRAGLRAILDADDRIQVVGVAVDRDAAVRHAARVKDFLSLAAPTRPARVSVRVVNRFARG